MGSAQRKEKKGPQVRRATPAKRLAKLERFFGEDTETPRDEIFSGKPEVQDALKRTKERLG